MPAETSQGSAAAGDATKAPVVEAKQENKPDAASSTDEAILRLGSRLQREFATVTQKLVDAEESLADIELSIRSIETGSRQRLAAVRSSSEKSADRASGRFKAVGEGLSRIKGWVSKKEDKEEGKGSEGGADTRSLSRKGAEGDLEDRLGNCMRAVEAEIRDRERESTSLDRQLHEEQGKLIRTRAQEQHAREMQVRIGQTKQLSEDLDRRMAALDDMVRTFEAGGKPGATAPSKPKAPPAGLPNLEDRLQGAIDEAVKAVSVSEEKVARLEKSVANANAALVEERTRLQRIRSMQMRLREARHFSADLQRTLEGLSGVVNDLRARSGNLLRPREKRGTDAKPAQGSGKASS